MEQTFSLQSASPNSLNRRIYIHFLDYYHYARSQNRHPGTERAAFEEALLAFRLAILLSNGVVLPASSFVEGPFARKILSDHQGLIQVGFVEVSASEPTLDEHIDSKLRQYDKRSNQAIRNAYLQGYDIVPPPYIPKTGSSVMAITKHWMSLLDHDRLQDFITPQDGAILSSRIENAWSKVPERLEGKAFVDAHVAAILEKDGFTQIPKLALSKAIEGPYTANYIAALSSGVITDLVYLRSPYILPDHPSNISFGTVATRIESLGLTSILKSAEVPHLLALKGSLVWPTLAAWLENPTDGNYQITDVAQQATDILKRGYAAMPNNRRRTRAKKAAGGPTIGIITALPEEWAAMRQVLDNPKDTPVRGDPNPYVVATVPARSSESSEQLHNVVLTMLVRAGTNSASTAATNLLRSFPTVRVILMVGIACAVPSPQDASKDVRLGDIVVSDRQGVVDFTAVSLGTESQPLRTSLPPPSATLLSAMNLLEAGEIEGSRPWFVELTRLTENNPLFMRPRKADRLYGPDGKPISRSRDRKRRMGIPRLFRGVIGSSNVLLRDRDVRDALRDRHNLRAIEMESSGLAETTWQFSQSYLAIRGTADYGDSFKNDEWHAYASAVASSFTRTLLEAVPADF